MNEITISINMSKKEYKKSSFKLKRAFYTRSGSNILTLLFFVVCFPVSCMNTLKLLNMIGASENWVTIFTTALVIFVTICLSLIALCFFIGPYTRENFFAAQKSSHLIFDVIFRPDSFIIRSKILPEHEESIEYNNCFTIHYRSNGIAVYYIGILKRTNYFFPECFFKEIELIQIREWLASCIDGPRKESK